MRRSWVTVFPSFWSRHTITVTFRAHIVDSVFNICITEPLTLNHSKLKDIQVIHIGFTRESAKYIYNITDTAALSTMHKLERFTSAMTSYTSLCSLSGPCQGPDLIDLFKVVQSNEDLH